MDKCGPGQRFMHSVVSRFEAPQTSSLTTLVGREEESEIMLRRWSRAKCGDGQVLLLSGEAGTYLQGIPTVLGYPDQGFAAAQRALTLAALGCTTFQRAT